MRLQLGEEGGRFLMSGGGIEQDVRKKEEMEAKKIPSGVEVRGGTVCGEMTCMWCQEM